MSCAYLLISFTLLTDTFTFSGIQEDYRCHSFIHEAA